MSKTEPPGPTLPGSPGGGFAPRDDLKAVGAVRLGRLAEATAAVVAATTPAAVLEHAADAARALTGAARVDVLPADPARVSAPPETVSPPANGDRSCADRSAGSEDSPLPLGVDPSGSDRERGAAASGWSEDDGAAARGRVVLDAPLRARDGRVLAVLRLSAKAGGAAFDAADAAAVGHLARVVGPALENAARDAAAAAGERRYRTLIEYAPVVFYEWSGDSEAGGPRYVSPRLEALLGGSPEAAVDRFARWRSLVHPDDLARVDAEDRRSDAVGDAFRAEYRLLRADGTWLWVRDVAAPLREGDRIVGWQGVLIDVSDEKRAAEAARAGEERLRLALEAARMASWDRDPRTGAVFRSSGWPELFGLPGESPTADRAVFLARVHPDDRAVLAEAERGRAAGGPYAVEYRVIHPDGAVRWLRDRGEAVLGTDGQPTRFLGVTQDITDRRRAEAALQAAKETAEAAERAMRQTLDALSDGFLSLAPDGRIRYLNPAAAAILRRGTADLADRNVWQEFPEAVATPFYRAFRTAVEEGRAAAVVEPYEPLGGWFEARFFPAADGASVILRDVTAARQAEAALREEAGRLAAVVAVQEEVAAVAGDAEAVMRLVVRRARELAGADGAGIALVEGDRVVYRAGDGFPAGLVGTPYPVAGSLSGECLGRNEVVRSDDAQTDARARGAVAGSFGIRSVLLAPLRHDGRAVGVLSLLSPRPGAFGDRDATLLRLLAGFVGAALAHAEAFAAAQEANRLKSQFLSTMSHELRTPLNAIVGYAHLLLDGMAGPLAPEQAGDVGQIAGAADRLLALVDDVLDLSRIEAGRLDLAREPVDLAALAGRVRDLVAPLAEGKGLDLAVAAAPGTPPVLGDPDRLRQVLVNLVGNAVKFTEAGRVRVRVGPSAAGDAVEVAVADTGIGIEPEALPRVFDEFRQADGSTTRRYGGSGLGLAISRKLVELHGGTIRAESEPGAGSVFTVSLPVPETRDERRETGDGRREA